MMKYKGYIGKVEYDDVNRIFSGSVVNIKSVITFQGNTVDEIETEFRASVDDYLDWCLEDGVEPEKPFSGKFNVRFSPELHSQAVAGAKLLGISLNSFVEKSVRDELRVMNG
jgi:predicted HicB family RNase H-like nuclease